MLFFRYFPLKNSSIEQLFNDFLEKTNEKIAIPYRHFLKEDKSNHIFRDWIIKRNYNLREEPIFEQYINNQEITATEDLLTEIFIPIKKYAVR